MAKRGRKRSAEEAVEGDDGSVGQPVKEEVDMEEDYNNDEDAEYNCDNDNNEAEEDSEMEEDDEQNGDSNGDDEDAELSPPHRHINQEGKPAEAGVIKSVNIENFMCHKKLTINLCRNINFINGQNGSGKSAILAAIQICLGASATRTHRASNLKDLIRKESTNSNPVTSAKLVVTLLNGGGDGYKPDVYGDEISVVRCISKGGYNGYKLLDAKGIEKSRSKKDLDEMLDYLNIQVDNPVAILDQEEAKKFLQGKGSGKYSFFIKATELDRIDRIYASAAERLVELSSNKEKMTDSLEAKRELVVTLKRKYEEHQLLEKLEKKVLEHHVDHAWAFFQERNQEYEAQVQKMEQFNEKAKKKQEELSQAEEEANGPDGDDEEQICRSKMDELQKEAESQTQLKRQLEADYKLAHGPVKAKEREISKAKEAKKQHAKDLKRAEIALRDARDEMLRQAGSAESEAAKRTKTLKRAEEDLAAAKQQSNAKKQAVATSLRDYEELEPAVEQAKSNRATKASHLSACKNKLKDLQQSAGNSLAMFGPKCEEVFRLVDKHTKAGKFNGPVLGPVGSFIKIAEGKEKYAQLAELALGFNTLDRFVVTNDHDRKVFQTLRKQARCTKECALFQVTPSARFNVAPPPSDDIETVASALTVSNDIIFNALVDFSRIDQRALAPSREVSEQQLLVADQNGRYKIKGCINEVLFLPQGDRWSVRDGSLSLTSNDKKLRRTIGVDKTAAIEEAKNETSQLEAELKELQHVEVKLSDQQKEAQRRWNVAKRIEQDNRIAIKKLSETIDDTKQEMETTANVTIDTTELEEDVAEAERSVKDDESLVEQLEREIEALHPQLEEIKARLDEVAARNDKVLDDMKEAEEALQTILHTQSQKVEIIDKKRKKLEKLEEVLKKHKEIFLARKGERDETLLRARKVTLRHVIKVKQDQNNENDENTPPSQANFTDEELEKVEIRQPDHDSKYYEAKINRGKAKIEKERNKRQLASNDDPAVAYEKYMRAKTDLDEVNNAIEDISSKVQRLHKDMRQRRRRWDQLQKHLASYTDAKFDDILRLNKNSGTLEFDHEKGELNLIVQKDVNDVNSQTKDVKALSGGERSYTTLSLLLALGESLETPFRVLDEFDVFLDTQARKLAIMTLIFIAKRMTHRQFIFISPQDLSSVTPDEMLKIFKLKPPERSQLAGGPSQQTLNFISADD